MPPTYTTLSRDDASPNLLPKLCASFYLIGRVYDGHIFVEALSWILDIG